ncbi:MAG: class I SAM-dependent methyltransferase [Acidobacteria bacterium]|nr:class I SAM-dependent methyltransferase [Acidobacteriota bacterium]
MNEPCPLCRDPAAFFSTARKRDYHLCGRCGAVFMAPRHHLSAEAEKKRYEAHRNDVDDPRYQAFVRPLVNLVLEQCRPQQQGLDFGCGTGPVVSRLLAERDYRLAQYDPFFRDRPQLLERAYDYIVCCEVIEHFRDPAREFRLLRSLLERGGRLFCQTELYAPGSELAAWPYANDTTHVIFYQERTLEWIRDHFAFTALAVAGRLAVFTA